MSKYIGSGVFVQSNETKDAKSRLWVAGGANLPSRFGAAAETLIAGITALGETGLVMRACSAIYETPCFPVGAGPDYVNLVAEFEVAEEATPEAVLARMHAVEARFGRERHARWAGRVLDLDLIAFEDRVCPDLATFTAWRNLPLEDQMRRAPDRLILPHPRLQDRGFVLIPFAEIAPGWRHPVSGETVAEMLENLPETEKTGVKRLGGVQIMP